MCEQELYRNFDEICSLKEYFENGYSAYSFYSDVNYYIVDGKDYPIKILYFIEESRNGSGLVYIDYSGYVKTLYEEEADNFSRKCFIGKYSDEYSEILAVTKEFSISNSARFNEDKAVKEIIRLRKQLKERV